jgi:hypothetical protein
MPVRHSMRRPFAVIDVFGKWSGRLETFLQGNTNFWASPLVRRSGP